MKLEIGKYYKNDKGYIKVLEFKKTLNERGYIVACSENMTAQAACFTEPCPFDKHEQCNGLKNRKCIHGIMPHLENQFEEVSVLEGMINVGE